MVLQIIRDTQKEQESRKYGENRQEIAAVGILELIFVAPLRFLMNLVFKVPSP